MTTQKNFTKYDDLLSTTLENDVLVIRQKQHIKTLTRDVKAMFSFYEYLESILSSKSYRAMVMFACPDKDEYIEYSMFMSRALSARTDNHLIDRLINLVNFFIRALSTLNGITVFAGRGTVSMFHLNLSLAYDYRIVADDTVFENPGAGIGMITKGSGYFLPRLIGVRKATEVLQWKTFNAEDALALGLIDRIVPVSKLEEETMQFVAANLEASPLLDIRKLFKCDIKELQRSLELEDRLIKERLKSPHFRKTFDEYCIKTFGCDMETLGERKGGYR
ncbi:MAG: enoyl-CoA hydratase/isomerase family protein [Syntrophobacteraceae bacterium]